MTGDDPTTPDWPADLLRREAAYEALDDLAQPAVPVAPVPVAEHPLEALAVMCLCPVAAVGFVFGLALLISRFGG